jgi:hypothetical protein
MSNYSLEVVRKVYDDDQGVALEVGPDCDGTGLVQLRAVTPASQEYFGSVDLTVTPKMAKLLGEALIKAAEEHGA